MEVIAESLDAARAWGVCESGRRIRTRRFMSDITACRLARQGRVLGNRAECGDWERLEHTWEKRALDWSLLSAASGWTALAVGRSVKVKGLGAEEEDVSEVVLVVDAMVGIWCGRCRGGGGGDQEWRDHRMEIGIDPTLRDVSAEDEDVIREPVDAFLLYSSFSRPSRVLRPLTRSSASASARSLLQNLGVFCTTTTDLIPRTIYHISCFINPAPNPATASLRAFGRAFQAFEHSSRRWAAAGTPDSARAINPWLTPASSPSPLVEKPQR